MKLVTKDHLERWADTTFSKADLPYLISRLIRATTPASTKVNIPSGSASYLGGWDGIVNCEVEIAYVPQGISLWEFGTSSDCKVKADSDYNKRKKDPQGFIPIESVFIFVTPRLWTKKDEWIAAKKAEHHWKDVKVYDSIDLEQWLDISLPVSKWFATEQGVNGIPFDDVLTAEEFWKEWSTGPIKLEPEIIVGGREQEQELLYKILQGEACIKAFKASTQDEAIAFIIAAAKMFPPNESENFFSKSLISDSHQSFRTSRYNTSFPLNLIPRFKEPSQFYAAAGENHHVLIPLGANDDFNQDIIDLPAIDRDKQIKSLIKSGLSKEDAERFSREAGGNITILRKLLRFPYNKAKWIEKENIREIIPALLLGRWNETFLGDIELIEKLSEQKYSDYLVTLNKWKKFEESPIIQIGQTWRLTSPLDLWTNLSSQLTAKDFQNIQECFLMAFKSGNPVIEPKDQNSFTTYFKKNKYSKWSREGLLQSLIFIGSVNKVKISNLDNPQNWVDNIIFNLLNDASGEIWISLSHELPLISEASPESFLKAIKKSLEKKQPEIMDMFVEEGGYLSTRSHHTGLLWALEGLAWLPEYLRDTSLILLQLSRLDPGGSLMNRPLNSISEIFKPWHYQTLASLDERIEILKYITEKEKESGWSFLIRLLPSYHSIAHPTHKMRWRMFYTNTNITYTYQEIWDTHSAVIEMLINLFDNNEEKFSQLIKETVNLSPKDRKRVLDWADVVYPNIKQEKYSTWEAIRGILNHHRSHPDADWALPEYELIRFEKLYNNLQPTDIINKYIWLFNEYSPAFPEGFKYEHDEYEKRYEQQQKHIDEERKTAVTIFLRELDLNKTLELRKKVKESRILGATLADAITTREDILTVCDCLYDDKNLLGFIHGFIYRKSIIENFDWIKSLFKELQEKEFSNNALSNVLIPLNQNQHLWDFVASCGEELESEYWKNIIPHFYLATDEEKTFGIRMLLKHKRFFSAIDIASKITEVISTDLLLEILQKVATEETSETPSFKGHEIERVLDELDKRTDIDKSKLIYLEWLYLPILTSYGARRSPKALEEELTNNPEFFVEVLKWIYIPEDKALWEKEQEGIPNEVKQNRAEQAYRLLKSWKKIPCIRDDNSIDEVELKQWIIKARNLAESISRLEFADDEIGGILAQYPENCTSWPEEKIFQIIEDINTDNLKLGYYIGMLNKRGASTRGAFDGGDIERGHADYFAQLENNYKNKFPNVAQIFNDLKQKYLSEAQRMDQEAERMKLEY